MSPLIATRSVAADGMVVAVGHAVDVLRASVRLEMLDGMVVAAGVVVAAAVAAAVVVETAGGADDAALVLAAMPSLLQPAIARVHVNTSARPPIIRVPPNRSVLPRILARYATHSRESRQPS